MESLDPSARQIVLVCSWCGTVLVVRSPSWTWKRPASTPARSLEQVLALVLLALVASGCREPPAQTPRPRLVLLYATCTLNKHFLSPYEPGVAFTPRLGAFAEEAKVFRRHMTESGQSGTAYASILSGLQADGHGVFRHPTRIADEVELIGEAFRDAGWEVAAWLEHGMASEELGYARGAGTAWAEKLTAGAEGFRSILDRLGRDPGSRALVVTDFTVTHGPYQPGPVEAFCGLHPDQCGAREDRAAFDRLVDFYRRAHAFLSYDFPATRERTAMGEADLEALAGAVELLYRANVADLDRLFGAVVAEIRRAGLWQESVVVFTADHGETLYREGTYFKWTHGHQLAPEVLEVPLLIRAPGVAAGDWEPVTRSIDVLPTLAGLAGVTLEPVDGRGVDLSRALSGREAPHELRAWSHTALVAEPVLEASRRWGLFRSLYPRIDPELMWVQVREGDRVWQLRRRPGGEPDAAAFDLASDPWQLVDLFAEDDPGDRRRMAELRRYHERLAAAYLAAGDRGEIGKERQEELLKSLSYVD